MDMWSSVGVNVADYLSKYYQNLAKISRLVPSMDRKIDEKAVQSGSCIFCNLIRSQVGDANCSNHRISSNLDGRSLKKLSDGEGTSYSDEYIRDHRSLLSLQPWIFRKEMSQIDANKQKVNGDFSDYSCGEPSSRNVSIRYGRGRGRTSLRSRQSRRYSVKPPASLGNCLIPQLYNEHFEIEENAVSSVPLRPFIITDGYRTISKSTCNFFESGLNNEVDAKRLGTVVGVPPLPQLRSPTQNSRDVECSKSPRTCRTSHSQDTFGGMILFFLGINIGIMSTAMSNRREIETLNDRLKHNENLVQDLQEELEMKESLTVKELANDAYESRQLNDNSDSIEDSIDSLQRPDGCDQPNLSKSEEISEFSRIEAELEAELERLELNMNASSLEGRLSALGELDPDLISDIVHGELRADNEAKRASSSTSTTEIHNANYAVSPRELSLLLHEVIQFRLEERIKELESELCQSQKQLEFIRMEQALNSEPESPTLSKQDTDGDSVQPLCLNLSGDAVHAYDEAYQEFLRPSTTSASKVTCKLDGSQIPCNEGKSAFDNRNFSRESIDISGSNESDDDEEEVRMLIQQIVEKTRQGSPAVAHAQKLLFVMDELPPH